ncbi:putative esterase PIR7A [Canna indica]|uniref:Esterase PIR7A n=1 Tax=Canna indica TaxID=4628 RepID=A0AAQ3QGM7_9LILI|nr:putative esterase PIR7A [Canna indica]
MEGKKEIKKTKHFVLVHGICQGAWCWYKLVTLLRSAGHGVTAIDLGATGVHPQRLDELRSFDDYAKPLFDVMAAVSPREKVVLVGHSFGGASVALAAEKFPEKVSAAVFVTAVLPSTTVPLTALAEEFFKGHPLEAYLDSEVMINSDPQNPTSRIKFGPNYIANKLYQLCSPEDTVLGRMLVREGSWFLVDLLKEGIITEKYGSVKKVFIACKEDLSMTEEFQRWMIDRCPGTEVKKIDGADHMAMLSKPQDLCNLLLEIATKY